MPFFLPGKSYQRGLERFFREGDTGASTFREKISTGAKHADQRGHGGAFSGDPSGFIPV